MSGIVSGTPNFKRTLFHLQRLHYTCTLYHRSSGKVRQNHCSVSRLSPSGSLIQKFSIRFSHPEFKMSGTITAVYYCFVACLFLGTSHSFALKSDPRLCAVFLLHFYFLFLAVQISEDWLDTCFVFGHFSQATIWVAVPARIIYPSRTFLTASSDITTLSSWCQVLILKLGALMTRTCQTLQDWFSVVNKSLNRFWIRSTASSLF